MESKKNNIRVLDDGARINQKVTPLQELFKNMSKIIEEMALGAMFKKVKYDALVKAGFTKTEALYLCKD